MIARTQPVSELTPIPTRSGAVAGMGQQIPVVYGVDRRDALIASVTDAGDATIFLVIWSIGEIDAVNGLTINDGIPPAGTVIRHYLGTSSQGVDPGLAAAVVGYADTLRATLGGHAVRVAYSVIEVADSVGYPRIAATIRGRKVFDPRTGITAWSDNPALILADYLVNPLYGTGRSALNVSSSADACDDLVGGERRRRAGITVNTEGAVTRLQWVERLRQYAGCLVVPEGAARKLVPLRPAAPVATLTSHDLLPDSVRISRPDLVDMPTVVRVEYQDTTSIPWRVASAVAYAPGVIAGTTPWIEELHTLHGCHSGAQAAREAAERINSGLLAGLEVEFGAPDGAIRFQAGDVITLDDPDVSGQFRLVEIRPAEVGFYALRARAYVPAVYTDESAYVQLLPPAPAPRGDSVDSPQIGGVTSGGGTYIQGGDGTVHNRIRVDLAVPASRDFARYEVRFRESGTNSPWQEGQVTGYTAHLFPVEDGVSYAYEARTVNKFGVASAWVGGTYQVVAKDTPPPAPTGLDVTVSPSGVRKIVYAYTNPPRDFAGFRVQYQASGGNYIDLLSGLTQRQVVETNEMPAGNVTVRVRAQDRTGNASAWVYRTSNIAQGSDGLWYDVDQRIETERQRNNNQDGTLTTHGGTLTTHNGTLTTHTGQIGTETVRNNNQDSTLSVHNTGINTAQNTANTANGTAVTLRDNTIPPIATTANNAQSTASNAQSAANTAQTTANSASSAASTAQAKANQAFDLAQYGTITHDRIVTPTIAAITANLGTITAGRLNFSQGGWLDLGATNTDLMRDASGGIRLTHYGMMQANSFYSQSVLANGPGQFGGNLTVNGVSYVNGGLVVPNGSHLICSAAADFYGNFTKGSAGWMNVYSGATFHHHLYIPSVWATFNASGGTLGADINWLIDQKIQAHLQSHHAE
jgi:hypothetical protein